MRDHYIRIKNMTTEDVIDSEITFEANSLYEAFVKSQPIINGMLKEAGWNKNDCDIRLWCKRCNNSVEEWLI